jgi:hypothetical protein
MKNPDCQWAVELIQRHTTGAKWVRLTHVGSERFTVTVRSPNRSESDQAVRDREAFLAALHPDIWQARLSRVDSDGESYEVIFTRLKQLDFSDVGVQL